MNDGSTDELSVRKAYIHIDELLCKALSQPVHPDNFLCHWVDTIGLGIAVGETLLQTLQNEIRALYTDDRKPNDERQTLRVKVAQWLLENTNTDAYYESKH